MFKHWLFIAAHPDDVELGCGGTISRFSNNSKMTYLVLSPAKEDSRNIHIIEELKVSARTLGIDRVVTWSFPRREFIAYRSEVRQQLYKFVYDINPEVIVSPVPTDLHQDHALIGEEVTRLFRDKNVLGYEVPNSNPHFEADLYVSLEEKDLKMKVSSLLCYRSQKDRYYFKPDVIKSLAILRGTQVKRRYAEAFNIIRMII